MPTDLSDTLVVGIAGTALQAYRQHMLKRERDTLADGTAMALARALLGLHRF